MLLAYARDKDCSHQKTNQIRNIRHRGNTRGQRLLIFFLSFTLQFRNHDFTPTPTASLHGFKVMHALCAMNQRPNTI